jgi:Endosomal/lysosomal potassium channel TMEM175
MNAYSEDLHRKIVEAVEEAFATQQGWFWVNEPSEGGLQRSPDLDRIAFFSDGVFAIAITLLVLEIRLPEPIPGSHASGLVSALVEELWPDFYSFLISFWFVGTLWMAHHRVFHYIRRLGAASLSPTKVAHEVGLLLTYCWLSPRHERWGLFVFAWFAGKKESRRSA